MTWASDSLVMQVEESAWLLGAISRKPSQETKASMQKKERMIAIFFIIVSSVN
jgi:hypothetical protein